MPDVFEDWKDVLRTAERESDPDDLLICWSGVIYDFSHPFVRLDNAFLNVIYQDHGTAVFRRTPGRKIVVNGEPVIEFSRQPLYRVTTGERKGHVMTLTEIKTEEQYRLAGLKKRLGIGTETCWFHPRRKGDRQVIEILDLLRRGYLNPLQYVDAMPKVLLTCSRDQTQIRIRGNGRAAEMIRNHPGFDAEQPVFRNLVRLRAGFCWDLGNGRVGYPFEWVYGRGVLAVDTGKFGCWYRVPKIPDETAYVRVR